ncbi:MAG: UDP-N-acetylglucosamine 2-epimerase [Candidatus Hermodarchaeota archaeon]
MKEKALIFYGKSLVDDDLVAMKELKGHHFMLVSVSDLKHVKSTFIKFFENELSSVRILGFIYDRILRYLLSKIKIIDNNRLNSKHKDLIDSIYDLQRKSLTDYVNAEIYERADKLAVELFNKVKVKPFIAENFIFNEINLYETNRLDFVEQYFQSFLILLAVQNVIEIDRPDKIYLSPSLHIKTELLINSVLKSTNYQIISKSSHLSKGQHFKNYFKRKIRIISEYNWFWILWKVFDKTKGSINISNMDQKLNLILSHYKNHFPALIQLLNQLNQNNKIKSLLYVPHKLLKYSKEMKFQNKLDNVYLIPHHDFNYKAFKEKYSKFSRVIVNVVKSDSFDDIQVNFIKASVLVKISFLNLFERFLESLRHLENIEKIYQEYKPNLVTMLSGNDTIDILATRIAKKLNILTFFFPHAMYSIRRDHDAFEQDYVVCSGRKDEEYFQSLGTEKEKLHILGLVLFDKLYYKFSQLADPKIIKKKIFEQFNLDTSKKLLLLVTTHDEDFVREKVFKSVIDLVKNQLNYQLIVKIHPIENISYYRNLLMKYGISDIIITKDIDLHEVIIASDVVIGRSSGAQIEAILLDKIVIDLSYEATTGRQLMEKFNAVIPVYNPRDLETAVKDSLYNNSVIISIKEGRRKYRDYTLHKFDGKASLRVKNLIEKALD